MLSVTMPDSTVLRLVNNTDDVTFQGNTYDAFAFKLDENKSGGGKIQGVTLRVANPERALQPYLEEFDGLVGCPLTLTVVHADNLTEDYADLTLQWDIVAAQPKPDWIDFTLGAENPLRRRFPLFSATPRACNWVFKGVECAYSGAATSCARNLDACRDLNNSARFGGRPGLVSAPRFVTR
jgi:phage-related protein